MRKIIFTLLLSFTFIGFSQNTLIPDQNFEQALIDLGIDSNPTPDGQVLTADIEGVTQLNVNSKNIADLTGIEGFIALTELRINNNQLTSLDVSNNPALTELRINNNQLTSLDVSNNPALTRLECRSNQLSSLDVSNNIALNFLQCYSNQLTSLDVSNNTALTFLNCNTNQLTSLDVRNGNNTAITSFNASSNPDLTCIFVDDISYSNANWTVISSNSYFVENEAECSNPSLLYTAIPDENFEQALIDLGIDTNPTIDGQVLTADIEGVTQLNVNSKNIADLTGIEGFIALTELRINNNQLTSLDVSNDPALTELRINNNQLTSLDVSNNPALTRLECGNNQLTSLDVRSNPALETLKFENNQLTDLDVRNGNNENITLFNASSNPDLTCIFVDDISYSNANWTDIDPNSYFVENEAECSNPSLLYTAIPDPNFEQALIDLGIDTNSTPDGLVLTANIEVVTQLNVNYKNIADLTGIEGFTALTNLSCRINQLTSLDVSNNPALTLLECGINQLSSLDVRANPALTRLECGTNQLSSLDVSENPALTDLSCNFNVLTSLDVSANPALKRLFCQNNQLSSLNVRNGNNTDIIIFNTINNPDLTCIIVDDVSYSDENWTDIDIFANFIADEAECDALFTAIPDENFEQALIDLGIDTNPTIDGQVLTADIEGVTNLDVKNKNIANLTGIEDFTALTILSCGNNYYLSSLDVSTNTALTYLNCSSNQLTSLDVSNNTALIELNCYSNQLTSLDVSNNSALIELNCNSNQLTSLDVSNNPALTRLECRSNQLSSLDVSNNIALNFLQCYSNQLTSLDVSNKPTLTRLECGSNQLTSLDVRANPALELFYCSQNQLSSLDVSENPALTQLYCNQNQLSSIDVSANPALEFLYCRINQLTSLDVTNNPALLGLNCSENQLTSLDVSNNIALFDLDIFDNQLTSLDVSNNPVLTLLECYSNQLTSLDVSNNPALTRLECGNNQLTSLDVRSNPALETLSSVGNQLTDLDVRNGNNTDLWFFNASSNPDLTCIFVDDVSYSDANWSNIDPNSYFVENEAECSNPSLLYTAIPDQNFEQALIDTGIANPTINGKVLTANIEVVTGFFIENKNITDLTGIEDFTALTFLDCSENQLTSLDFSNNTALTSFDCANNQLTSIDLSQNAVLTDFSCGNNQLTSIDLSQNPALIQLNCANNQLSSIDVSANNALTNLYCQNNQLSSLDVSNNPALFDLRCIDNQLTSIDVSANPALYILICDSNQLTSLDVSDNNALAALYCYNNQLTSLDVSANPALIELSCDNNQLTSLDVRNGNNTDFWFFNATTNPNLTCIFVDDVSYSFANWTDIDPASTFVENEAECSALYTAIPDPNFEQALIDLGIDTNPTIDGQVLTADIEGVTQLGVSSKNIADLKGIEGFISLTELFCFSNQLTSLDVTNNIALTILDVGDNLLTSLDLSNNIALTELECDENQLTGLLDLSNNIILNILECQVNKIEILNIKNGNNTNVTNFNASTNPDLYCIVVDDISYSTTNWTNIDPASTFVNNETDCELLSIEYNNFELEVAIYPNPTDNYLFIEGNVNPVSITIYNLLGAKVIAKSNTDKIDVSELSKGVYIIKISDGVSQTNKKFVKN